MARFTRAMVQIANALLAVPAQAADGDDSLVFLIRQDGTSSVSQRGRDVSLRKGDGVGFLGAEPASAAVSEVECLSLVTSRTALAFLIGNDVAGKAMRVIPSHCEAMRLLTNYAGILRQGSAPTTPELRHLVSIHIHDLIAMVLGATRDGLALAAGRGLRAARLRAIKADILANLCDSDLTVNAVALRQRVTPRYVQILFQAEGVTFSEFVPGQRLMRVYHGLRDPNSGVRASAALPSPRGLASCPISIAPSVTDLACRHRTCGAPT